MSNCLGNHVKPSPCEVCCIQKCGCKANPFAYIKKIWQGGYPLNSGIRDAGGWFPPVEGAKCPPLYHLVPVYSNTNLVAPSSTTIPAKKSVAIMLRALSTPGDFLRFLVGPSPQDTILFALGTIVPSPGIALILEFDELRDFTLEADATDLSVIILASPGGL